MRKSNFPPRLQPSLLDEARKLSEAEGVAEKLSALHTEDYFAARAARADVPAALDILKRAGRSRSPVEGDEVVRKRAAKGVASPR